MTTARTLLFLTICLLLCSTRSFGAGPYDELLHQYRPHLYTTKKEFSPPIAIETMLDQCYLVDTEKNEIVKDDAGRPCPCDRQLLAAHDDERYAVKLWTDYTELLGRSKRENYQRTPSVVYARAVECPADRILALQYFFFYAGSYTGKLVVGAQLPWHEGDTEYAQVILDLETKEPIGASSSIHYYGDSKRWDELRFHEDGRVKMYVAQHSHATYFSPSRWPGHQAMEGNLGFGGKLMISLRTVFDYCREDREVDYELRPLADDDLVFTWKGRWGWKEKLHAVDQSLKAHEPGPVSFAYRNAMSERLSMFDNPSYFYYFYFLPSAFYQRMLLTIKDVEDSSVRDEMYDLIYRIGRLRAKVDSTLAAKYDHLSSWQKTLLAEAAPFVVLCVAQEKVAAIYELGKERLGITAFQKLMRSIAEQNVEQVMDHIDEAEVRVAALEEDPLNLYTVAPELLLGLLARVSGLEAKTIVEIYKESHQLRNSDETVFSKYHLLHLLDTTD